MIGIAARNFFTFTAFFLLLSYCSAQNNLSAENGPATISKPSPKPYTVLTNGKHITIKSNKNIKHVMLWTSRGDRVVEQREINDNNYTINITINEKVFFLMVGLADGKIYTEKIGIQ